MILSTLHHSELHSQCLLHQISKKNFNVVFCLNFYTEKQHSKSFENIFYIYNTTYIQHLQVERWKSNSFAGSGMKAFLDEGHNGSDIFHSPP